VDPPRVTVLFVKLMVTVVRDVVKTKSRGGGWFILISSSSLSFSLCFSLIVLLRAVDDVDAREEVRQKWSLAH